MEDWLKYQIRPLVKYHQNKIKIKTKCINSPPLSAFIPYSSSGQYEQFS